MTPQFKNYIIGLARIAGDDSEAADAAREELSEWWRDMTEEERDLANDLAKALSLKE